MSLRQAVSPETNEALEDTVELDTEPQSSDGELVASR
jgi:hypothetical protein